MNETSSAPREKGLNIGAKSFISAILVILVLMIVTYLLTLLIPAGEYQRILDENGNYLGMNPGSTALGFKNYRGGIVNNNLIINGGNYDDGYDAGGRFSLTSAAN